MAVDYDLVILGGSAIARYAAWQAAHLRARVALVEPEDTTLLESHPRYALRQAIWMQWTQNHQSESRHPFLWGVVDTSMQAPLNLLQGMEWATDVVDVYAEWRSPIRLAAAGVDLIVGQGEFCRRPLQGVMARGRLLRARAYLLAPPSTVSTRSTKKLDNIDMIDVWTPDSFWMYPPTQLPKQMVVVGVTARGIELAQTLARLGVTVTLVCDRSMLLPNLDPDLNGLLQNVLEADGIAIWTNTVLKSVEAACPNEIQLTLAHATLPPQLLNVDSLMIDMPLEPLLVPLNLEAVQLDPHALTVNDRLQTANHQIFALSATIYEGDRTLQADIAIHNALFPWKRSIRSIPSIRVLHTHPPVVTLGLTETEAQNRYGTGIITIYQPYTSLAAAHIQGDLTGACKLVLRRDGRLLGAHLLGQGVLDVASAIAPLLQNKGSIQQLLTLPIPDLGFATVLKHAAHTWQHQRSDQGRRRDCLEGWLELARSWTR